MVKIARMAMMMDDGGPLDLDYDDCEDGNDVNDDDG